MPLIKTCNLDAYRQNISDEIKAGKPQDQALAIARSTLETACREVGKPSPLRPLKKMRPKDALSRVQKMVNPRDFAMVFQWIDFLEDMMSDLWLEFDGVPDILGPEDASLLFIGDTPERIEKEPELVFTEKESDIFRKHYLEPFKLQFSDIALGFLRESEGDEPNVAALRKKLEKYPNAKIITLGKRAKAFLGDLVDVALPHPAAIGHRKQEYNHEMRRKIAPLLKKLDNRKVILDNTSDLSQDQKPEESSGPVTITKSVHDKRIVYGVVLDPYVVDSQDDLIPPSVVEKTAHGYMQSERVIGFEHVTATEGVVVESHLIEYPTTDDYKAAMAGLDHNALIRKFGSDVVRSGSWVLGVKLGPKEWELFKTGQLTGFSVGGFGTRETLNPDEMPKVSFIEQGTLDSNDSQNNANGDTGS